MYVVGSFWHSKRKLLDEEGSAGHIHGEDEMDEGTFSSRYTENTWNPISPGLNYRTNTVLLQGPPSPTFPPRVPYRTAPTLTSLIPLSNGLDVG